MDRMMRVMRVIGGISWYIWLGKWGVSQLITIQPVLSVEVD